MTGYGRGEVQVDGGNILVEIKSVNNRFLDIALRIPKKFSVFEDKIKEIVQQEAIRGRIDVFISTSEERNKMTEVKVNYELASDYLRALKDLKKDLNLPGKITISEILKFDDILIYEYLPEEVEYFWPRVKETLLIALKGLREMRSNEGKNLEKDLRKRVENLENNLNKVIELSGNRVEQEFEKLREKVKSIIKNNKKLDEERLELEIVLMAERMDITEECTRLRSHIMLFLKTLEKEGAVGRKLDFILQEMNREVSTIGAKCNSAEIAHRVVEMKEEIEKIREQARNIL